MFQPLGLVASDKYLGAMVLHRFSFFRAQVSFCHPIDLGNCGLILAAMILLLASTTPVGTKDIYVRLAVGGAIFCVVAAISFTGFVGLGATVAIFVLIGGIRYSRRLLVPLAILGIAAGIFVTLWLVNQPLGERPKEGEALAGSVWVRTLIVQNSWKKMVGAGAFGWGRTIRSDEVGLDSIDNAYTLTTLWYGWATLTLWLLLPIALAWRGTRAFGRIHIWRHAFPLTLTLSTIFGVLIAMYTVWFGDVYSTLFLIMVGFAVSLMDFYLAEHAAVSAPVLTPPAQSASFANAPAAFAS